MRDPSARPSWRDNEGVAALRRLSEALERVAGLADERGSLDVRQAGAGSADLPLQNLPSHVVFARVWEQRRSAYLARCQPRACPICRAPPAASWFDTQDGYRYVRCHVCAMIYVPEFLPLDVWNEYFGGLPESAEHLRRQLEASITDEAAVRDRDRFGRYFSALKKQGAKLSGARLLDVGSFTGASLRVAAEHGMIASGVEGLAEAVRFSRERFPGIRLEHATAEQIQPVNSSAPFDPFDVVTLWETLEHTVDPLQALKQAAGVMKPGAWLALTVPNARNVQFSVLRELCFFAYGGYNGIGHINMFTPDSLKRALVASGFTIRHLSTEFGSDWRQLLYYLQQNFDRIQCYRQLISQGVVNDAPGPELEVLLNWLSPTLTKLENAASAGPILFVLAQRA